MQDYKKEIREHGFYNFVRTHVKDSDVANIILDFVDMTTSRLDEEDYDQLIENLLDSMED